MHKAVRPFSLAISIQAVTAAVVTISADPLAPDLAEVAALFLQLDDDL
jgi:hypothetical protein